MGLQKVHWKWEICKITSSKIFLGRTALVSITPQTPAQPPQYAMPCKNIAILPLSGLHPSVRGARDSLAIENAAGTQVEGRYATLIMSA